jgi:hypothetical protein
LQRRAGCAAQRQRDVEDGAIARIEVNKTE